MNMLCDHNDLLHWLETTKTYVINLFSCSFSNLDSRLVRTLTGCGFLFSPNQMVTSILYAIIDVIHTQVEMGYD
jgi:hypothetical protein